MIKSTIKIAFVALFFLLLNACESEESTPQPEVITKNRILPLGASRVQGARPIFESYRYELWKDLTENGWTFDFIGTQMDPVSYPAFQGKEFDKDHEGRGGWTSQEVLDGLSISLTEAGIPDIVLFSSPGGNDALQGQPYSQALVNINTIIDRLQEANPNVTIILEQMAPGRSDVMTEQLSAIFTQFQTDVVEIAEAQTTSTSSVITVDMYTGFSDSFLADGVHYNEAGAEFIASRYYNVLKDLLEE